MLQLGLSADERAALMRTLTSSHRMRVTVGVLDRNERPIASLTAPASRVLDGSVEVDANADITRSLGLTLFDPTRALQFDAASPARGALHAERMLRVSRGAYVRELGRWVDMPAFTGPLTLFERAGAEVRIEGLGKEALGLDPHFARQGYTIRKGRRVDDAIRDVMNRLGERRYSIPKIKKRLPKPRAVEPDDEPWDVVKFGWEAEVRRRVGKGKRRRRERVTVEYNGLVSLAGPFTAFYDANGRLVVRRRNVNPVHVFREGEGGHLLGDPVPTFDVLAAVNTVVVIGATVTKGKKPNRRQVEMRGSATLPASHPLSPQSLGRNGRPRYMTEFLQVDNLKTRAACRARAARVLKERSRDGLSLAFESLPVPMIEEGDTVRVVTAGYSLDFRLSTFTIPLSSDAPMRVGWTR